MECLLLNGKNSSPNFLGSGLVTSAPVRLVDKENHSVEIVVTDKQAQQLSKAAESGEKMVLVYH